MDTLLKQLTEAYSNMTGDQIKNDQLSGNGITMHVETAELLSCKKIKSDFDGEAHEEPSMDSPGQEGWRAEYATYKIIIVGTLVSNFGDKLYVNDIEAVEAYKKALANNKETDEISEILINQIVKGEYGELHNEEVHKISFGVETVGPMKVKVTLVVETSRDASDDDNYDGPDDAYNDYNEPSF